MTTILYTVGISLFDSLSTPQQIIIFVLLLTTSKPLRNAVSYLVGLSVTYFLCGIGGYLALDQVKVLMARFFPAQPDVSNSNYYLTEFLMGIAFVTWGIWYFRKKKKEGWSGGENKLIEKLRSINPWLAFGLGVVISVTSFSLPYLVALGKYSALHVELPVVIGFVLFYNIIYVSPMLLVLLVYLKARKGTEDDHSQLHEKAKMLNLHLTAWTLVGYGIFSIIDAGCFFVFGQALMKDRFF